MNHHVRGVEIVAQIELRSFKECLPCDAGGFGELAQFLRFASDETEADAGTDGFRQSGDCKDRAVHAFAEHVDRDLNQHDVVGSGGEDAAFVMADVFIFRRSAAVLIRGGRQRAEPACRSVERADELGFLFFAEIENPGFGFGGEDFLFEGGAGGVFAVEEAVHSAAGLFFRVDEAVAAGEIEVESGSPVEAENDVGGVGPDGAG